MHAKVAKTDILHAFLSVGVTNECKHGCKTESTERKSNALVSSRFLLF